MIRYCQLNISDYTDLLAVDLGVLRDEKWNPHLNRAQYTGDWEILSLIAPGGSNSGIADALNSEPFLPTSLLEGCPGISSLLASFDCKLRSVRLMNLRPGAILATHRDVELSFEHGEARLHIPLQTNPGVNFIIDGERLDMRVGTCWYINANLPHSVRNDGLTERIHLVIDCEVNDWLRSLFADSPLCSERTEPIDFGFQRAMIESLLIQGTDTSRALAQRMEEELASHSGFLSVKEAE